MRKIIVILSLILGAASAAGAQEVPPYPGTGEARGMIGYLDAAVVSPVPHMRYVFAAGWTIGEGFTPVIIVCLQNKQSWEAYCNIAQWRSERPDVCNYFTGSWACRDVGTVGVVGIVSAPPGDYYVNFWAVDVERGRIVGSGVKDVEIPDDDAPDSYGGAL